MLAELGDAEIATLADPDGDEAEVTAIVTGAEASFVEPSDEPDEEEAVEAEDDAGPAPEGQPAAEGDEDEPSGAEPEQAEAGSDEEPEAGEAEEPQAGEAEEPAVERGR